MTDSAGSAIDVSSVAWKRQLWEWMTEESRRIARLASRLGYRSVTLGNATERHWDALRIVLECEDASDRVLADAVDTLLRWEIA